MFPIVVLFGPLRPRGGDAQLVRALRGAGARAGRRGTLVIIAAASWAWCPCSRRATRSTRTRSGSWWAPSCSSCCRCRGCAGAGGDVTLRIDWRDERVRRVLKLMVPVTLALGLINLSLLINSVFGVARVGPGAGGDRQGVPHLHASAGPVLDGHRHDPVPDSVRASRRGASARTCAAPWRNGVRQICLFLIPLRRCSIARPRRADHAAASTSAAPSTQDATDLVSEALVWWSFSLPFQGVSLLFSRTFFTLQRALGHDRAWLASTCW